MYALSHCCTIKSSVAIYPEYIEVIVRRCVLSISLRFERREYLREGVARAVRNGSSRKATAIQATDMRFTSRGFAWRKTTERSLHALTQIFTPFEAK